MRERERERTCYRSFRLLKKLDSSICFSRTVSFREDLFARINLSGKSMEIFQIRRLKSTFRFRKGVEPGVRGGLYKRDVTDPNGYVAVR